MRVSAKVRIPSNRDGNSTEFMSWLITHVGLQTISWEWVFDSGEIFVAFYKEEKAEEFRKVFGL